MNNTQAIKLHIISSDVPFPPDYGGMVDVFYKIKCLKEAGVQLYLHCFEYGRGRPPELKDLCEQVFYYKRKTGLRGISINKPYMMASRSSNDLLDNLVAIDAPILYEGIHTIYYLDHPALSGRFKIIRNQNVEQDYYQRLADREAPGFAKLYYQIESRLLRKKESQLHSADAFFTVAEHDHVFFEEMYPDKIHEYIPSFHPYNTVKIQAGTGKYILYHGNLAHPENVEAALFLLKEVAPKLNFPFIFAGKDPDEKLRKYCDNLPHCSLIENPDMTTMEQLIAGAQVNVLPTFQPTGLKLKLLHALFIGRHAVVNNDMVKGTGLASACRIAKNAEDVIKQIKTAMQQPFEQTDIVQRSRILSQRYDNIANAQRIIACLKKGK